MTRKELIAYDRWLTENKWGSSEIVTPEQAADLYLAEHPLPPAEGAEQRIRVRNILQDFYRRGEYELEQAEEDIMRLFQPQPTAEGAELKDDKPCNKCTYNGHTTICEQCNDGNDYEHFTYNDPYSKESMNFFKVFIKARKDLCAISPAETYSLEEAIRKAFDGFFPQPTAEGAEEFLKLPQNHGKLKYCPAHFLPILIRLIEGFATLHAQRIADKMVSERMKKVESLLNMAAGLVGNPCTNISSSCDIACDDWQGEYNEYLKSKEK